VGTSLKGEFRSRVYDLDVRDSRVYRIDVSGSRVVNFDVFWKSLGCVVGLDVNYRIDVSEN